MIQLLILSKLILAKPQVKPYRHEQDVLLVVQPVQPPTALPASKLVPMPTIEPLPVVAPENSVSSDNLYAWGNCTWGVKNWRPELPNNLGNANTWAVVARDDGLSTGTVPKVNAVAQTAGDSWLGHVALVTAVFPDNSFQVREENYNGLGIIDYRTTTTAEFPNFIY